jgi:hypothetical protein
VTNLDHAHSSRIASSRGAISSVRQDQGVTELPPDLTPDDGERGVLSSDPAGAGARALTSWDAFIALAEKADLGSVARAKGRLGREVCLPLGTWPQTRSLGEILADARASRTTPAVDLEQEEGDVRAAQADATDREVVDALRRTREDLAAFLSLESGVEYALVTASPLGPLPVLTLLHAAAYQLSVCALDLEPCGATPSEELLEWGVIALVDTTGALAARQGIRGSITALLPGSAWGFGSHDGDWRTTRRDRTPGESTGPAVEAEARVILDVTAGRALNVPALWRDGALVTHDVAGLMRLAPVLEQVPGIPGGTAMRTASKAISGVSRLIDRLPGWPL